MQLECDVISFTRRPYTDKTGALKDFVSVLVRVGDIACELSVDPKLNVIPQGHHVLKIGLRAYRYEPKFFVEAVLK